MSTAGEHHKYTIAYGLFLLASALYLWGIAPTIYWRDSPEFVTGAHLLGITHPAGAPTYTLLAKLFAFLPVGSSALRINLFSAFCGALTISLLFLLLATLFASTSPWTRYGGALSGALFLLVSESFWRFSEVAEVYTLQDCLLIVLILILLRAHTASAAAQTLQHAYYWLFAFVYGLSAGVHATMAFFAPAFLLFIGLTQPCMFWGKRLAFLAFFFLLGMAVYLYLPLRSLGEPALDWGDTETWQQFVIHVTDRKDAATHFELPWPKMPSQIQLYLSHLVNEFSLFGCLLGLVGFSTLWRHNKPLSILLSLIFLGNVGFFIRSWKSAFGFLPSFVVFALWIGCGVHAGLTLLTALYRQDRIRIPRPVPYACFVGGLTLVLSQTLLQHRHVASQAENYSAETYGKHLLEQLPADAILFSSYGWFPLLYLQQVEHRRPDVTSLLQSEIFYPSRFAYLSQERFPYITLITSDEPIETSTVDYFWQLCQLNSQNHPLFWEPDSRFQRLIDAYLRPEGLLFAFTPGHEEPTTSHILQRHNALIAQATQRILHNTHDMEGYEFLAERLNLLGTYFRRHGFAAQAAAMYQAGLLLDPDRFQLHNNYGGLLLSQKHFPEALVQLQVAYHQEPYNPIVNKNLGLLFLLWEKPAQAAHFFERALTLESSPWDTFTFLGETYIKLGRFPEAMQALQAALTQYKEGAAHKPDIPEALSTIFIEWARENLHYLSQGGASKLVPHPFLRRADSLPN